jgi:hypothetical protein
LAGDEVFWSEEGSYEAGYTVNPLAVDSYVWMEMACSDIGSKIVKMSLGVGGNIDAIVLFFSEA